MNLQKIFQSINLTRAYSRAQWKFLKRESVKKAKLEKIMQIWKENYQKNAFYIF